VPIGDDQALVGEGEAVKVLAFPHDFNAYLVEAIKELKAENEELRHQLVTLSRQQAALVDLGRQVEVLRRRLDLQTAAVSE